MPWEEDHVAGKLLIEGRKIWPAKWDSIEMPADCWPKITRWTPLLTRPLQAVSSHRKKLVFSRGTNSGNGAKMKPDFHGQLEADWWSSTLNSETASSNTCARTGDSYTPPTSRVFENACDKLQKNIAQCNNHSMSTVSSEQPAFLSSYGDAKQLACWWRRLFMVVTPDVNYKVNNDGKQNYDRNHFSELPSRKL